MDAPSRLDRLKALRSIAEAALAAALPAREIAAISKEYRALLAEIEKLEASATKAGDPVDEIAARRAARRSASAARSGHAKLASE